MVPKQEPPQPLKRNSLPGEAGNASAPCGEDSGGEHPAGTGELTEAQLGLEEGLEFLQLWRRMETEK